MTKKMTKKRTSRFLPLCPSCDLPMVKRSSARGEFWGCSQYPKCRGTRPCSETEKPKPGYPRTKQHPQAAFAPIKVVSGSTEQEAIWKYLLKGKSHMVVEALAGTGKTFTSIQGCLRLPKKTNIAFVAFNRHIATKAQGKLKASGCNNVLCCTYHSLGLRMVTAAFPHAQIREHKVDDILEQIPTPSHMTPEVWRSTLHLTAKLVGLAKNYLLDPADAEFAIRLEQVADHHGIDLNGIGRLALDMVPRVMEECKRTASTVIDFDDMVWLPVVLKLPAPFQFDIMFVDEAQDTNLCQQELALMVVGKGRLVIVGDPHQSIYGFRGADVTAMPRMTERLGSTKRGVKKFPLTVTRRCPVSHVQLAQAIVPEIKAMPDAPEGAIRCAPKTQAVTEMKPGDLVLCRVNAPLVPIAYALLRQGIKAVIRGRDIGKGLLDLIGKLEKRAFTLEQMITELQQYRTQETQKLLALGDKASGRLQALQDRCDCLFELMLGAGSVADLKTRIGQLFADFDAEGKPVEAVVLGTVHRTKGLEGERVFILSPELIPHPMAKQTWEQEQERNLAYVAATRAKYTKTEPGTLVFCGLIPSIFEKGRAAQNAKQEVVAGGSRR